MVEGKMGNFLGHQSHHLGLIVQGCNHSGGNYQGAIRAHPCIRSNLRHDAEAHYSRTPVSMPDRIDLTQDGI